MKEKSKIIQHTYNIDIVLVSQMHMTTICFEFFFKKIRIQSEKQKLKTSILTTTTYDLAQMKV